MNSTIAHKIKVVVSGSDVLQTLTPCVETNSTVTWEIEQQPTGYWTPEGKWTSLLCRMPEMTPQRMTSCLKNSTVWIYGDSNGVRLIDSLSGMTRTQTTQPGYWPVQYTKMDRANNIVFIFTPSEYPVFLGQAWTTRLPYGGVAKQIDKIPSTGSHVVIIHYFLHIASSHLNIAFLRFMAVRDAIQRLLDRNPNVTVAIRGPHVSSVELNYNHAIGGDNLGIHIQEIIRYIFKDLIHRVIFLDGWEMTVAMENSNYHPDNAVPFEMARTLLAFKCS